MMREKTKKPPLRRQPRNTAAKVGRDGDVIDPRHPDRVVDVFEIQLGPPDDRVPVFRGSKGERVGVLPRQTAIAAQTGLFSACE